METIVKAFKFRGFVNTIIGDTLDQILETDKFREDLSTFIKEYLHEHPDEIDNVYIIIMSSNPSISVIINREKISLIINGEKFFNDQEEILEAIVTKKDCSQEKMKNIIKQKYFNI